MPGPVRLCTILFVGVILVYVFGSGATLGLAAYWWFVRKLLQFVQFVLNVKRKMYSNHKKTMSTCEIIPNVFFPLNTHAYRRTSFDDDGGNVEERIIINEKKGIRNCK